MRVAIVDLGTNTFNLLIADAEEKKFSVVYTGREVVKLGEKSINENKISEAAFKRGIDAFIKHAGVIREKSATTIKAFATSAIREALNGSDFIKKIKEFTGIEVEVIDGNREAELIYLGNRLAVNLDDRAHLIMDIGGGSTEFIIADNQKIFWKQSFKLGVARLLEKFQPEDPITEDTLEQINTYLKEMLQPLISALKNHKVNCLVGSSGGFESVVEMIGAAFNKEHVIPAKHCYVIDLNDYFLISKKTIHSTAAQRETMIGLIPMRRDMIVLTYLLIDFVVKETGIDQFKVSSYALKEGALSEIITNKC
ncbi:MAG TPA: exopolyphosphatase [Bacteroidia bacterium]|jgi:exopolyphosphatase/guanosine-5'-triphosphate,3'-diphosphate pyrophosphatase|nr:exopolyphosphatase [Bacteroidia bacterium]